MKKKKIDKKPTTGEITPTSDKKDEMKEDKNQVLSTISTTSIEETLPPMESRLSRLVPRAAYAISMEYTNDFDDNGVFSYIGSKGNTETWTNPASRGRIRLSSSSTEKGNIITVLDKTPKEFWTSDVPSSWIQISLGSTRTLLPNYYTLRHGGNSKADALRNWVLQGSNDGKNWTVLKRHVNDTLLNGNFASSSWPITDCARPFRHFRGTQEILCKFADS